VARFQLIEGAVDGAQPAPAPEALPDDEALDAYSRTVTSVAERLRASVANLQVRRRTRRGRAEGGGSAVAITPDGRHAVSAAYDRTLRVWNLESRGQLRGLQTHRLGMVTAVAIASDGRRAISASEDGTLRVWEPESGRELQRMTGHEGAVRAVGITPDGRRAVSASDDGTLRVWELEHAKCEATAPLDGGVVCLAVAASGIVTGGETARVFFFFQHIAI